MRQVSELLVTKPYGGVEQEDFLNGCLELETLLTPQELLEELHRIEQEAGRERKIHWGPRTLDLDILFYDKELIETEDLIIPHVDLENRYFVLKPLAGNRAEFQTSDLEKNRDTDVRSSEGGSLMTTILFDLDGTIINSFLGITRCVQYALRFKGIDVENLEDLEEYIGPPLKQTFQKNYDFSDEETIDLIRKYRERFDVTGILKMNSIRVWSRRCII